MLAGSPVETVGWLLGEVHARDATIARVAIVHTDYLVVIRGGNGC